MGSLAQLKTEVADCHRCPLRKGCRAPVFASGKPSPLVLVGEAPGANEDRTGVPFTGDAGGVLDDALTEAGLARSRAYVTNLCKCRPPANRNPTPEEIAACRPYLVRQLSILRPQVIVALGRFAAQALTHSMRSISSLREDAWQWRNSALYCTWHPAYVLRQPSAKASLVRDLQQASFELRRRLKEAR